MPKVKFEKPGSDLKEGQVRICKNCTKSVINIYRVGIIHTNDLYCCYAGNTPGKHLVAE